MIKMNKEKIADTYQRLQKAYHLLREPFRKPTYPDSPVLRSHYEFMTLYFFMMFFTVMGHWPESSDIQCVSKSDRSEPNDDYYDYCLYYGYATLNGEKGYPLFYRYTHWIFLLMAAFYGLLRIVMYFKRKPHLSSLLDELKNIPFDIEIQSTKILTLDSSLKGLVQKYIQDHFEGESRAYFFTFFSFHAVAFILNASAFFVLDFLLQKRYHNMFLYATHARDYQFFQDIISFSFPHYVDCDITPKMHIISHREELLGCHLPYMIWFEKYFVITYVLQLFLVIFNGIYVIYKFLNIIFLRLFGRVGYEPRFTISKQLILKELEKNLPHEVFGDIIVGLVENPNDTTIIELH